MDLQTIANGRTTYPISTVRTYPNLVRSLQTALNRMGFNAGVVDGTWDQITDAAYRSFAQRFGYTVDQLSPRAATQLLPYITAQATPTPPATSGTVSTRAPLPSPSPTPRPSSSATPAATTTVSTAELAAIARGIVPSPISTVRTNTNLVRAVQTALNNMGFSAGTVDGTWGTGTDAAYRAFALRFGFKATEISPRAASLLLSSGGISPAPSPQPIPTPRPPSPSPNPPSPTPNPPQGNFYPEALQFTLRWEGGYVNHPSDPGGATNKGVTQGVYDSYRRQKGLSLRSVLYITDTEVQDIYQNLYWKPARCDIMSRAMAIVHFDTAVNFGVTGSILFLQETLGVSADGSFGPMTEAALTRSNNTATARRYVQGRINYRYDRVAEDPSQQVFLQGWLNRDNDLMRYIANM